MTVSVRIRLVYRSLVWRECHPVLERVTFVTLFLLRTRQDLRYNVKDFEFNR